MDCFVSYENKLLVRHQWFACVLYCVKSFVFTLREIVQPTLQHSLVIRLLRFEITFNAGVLFFFFWRFTQTIPSHCAKETSPQQALDMACWIIICFFLFYLQGLINMKLYDNQLYVNLEDLTWPYKTKLSSHVGAAVTSFLWFFTFFSRPIT